MPTILQIKVKPNTRTSSFVPTQEGTWVAHLKSPPVDGKANAELIALVAAYFGCKKAAVSIKSGISGKMKRVIVDL